MHAPVGIIWVLSCAFLGLHLSGAMERISGAFQTECLQVQSYSAGASTVKPRYNHTPCDQQNCEYNEL